MEVSKQNKSELMHLKSYDEISDFLEQTNPISKKDILYLKQNLGKIIMKNKNHETDSSITRFFLNIQKLFPHSSYLIYLILQLNEEENVRRLIREKKEELLPILEYIYIAPIERNANQNNREEYFFLQDVPQFLPSTTDLCYDQIVLYTEEDNPTTVLAFIEEWLPYFQGKNIILELNLHFLLGSDSAMIEYLENHWYQEKMPLSIIFQSMDPFEPIYNYYHVIRTNIMKHIKNIELYVTGRENIKEIYDTLNNPLIEENKLLIQEKILNAIVPIETYTNIKDINMVGFIQAILYLQEEFIKGNPYFKSEVYKKCLNALFTRYNTRDNTREPEQKKIDFYFRKVLIEEGSKEKDIYIRKEKLLNTILKINKTSHIPVLLTFFKIGILLPEAKDYTIEELDSYNADDFYILLKMIKQKYHNDYFREFYLEEFALKSLIKIGSNLSFSCVTALNKSNYDTILATVTTIKSEEKELFFSLLNKLLQLIEKYQKNEPYKNTPLQKEAYQDYINWIKGKWEKEEIDLQKIKFVFHKMIQTGDLQTYLLDMDLEKKLIIIFKTPYIKIDFTNFTLKEIEEFNPKQYSDIRNYLLEKQKQVEKKENSIYSNEQKINTLALKLICYLGYELSKQILKDKEATMTKLEWFLSGFPTSPPKIDEFRKFFKKQPHIFELHSELLNNYYNWYMDLSNNLGKEVTYEDIVTYESGARENLFKNPIYLPICNNILLIQKKDFSRNAYKTAALWEKQIMRKESTIPELEGPLKGYTYKMVDLHDPDLIFLPNIINCCMEIGGKAEADLVHAVTNKNGRIFAIYQSNQVKAISWVWRNGQVLCFDNIEVKRDEMTKELGETIKEILIQASNHLLEISKQQEPPEEAIRIITLGRNPADIPMDLDEEKLLSKYQKEMYTPEEKENLYLIDSSKVQYIIAGTHSPIKQLEVTTTYPYPRKSARKFEELDIQYLDHMIESIRNRKGICGETPIYQLGYLGEDFYVGVRNTGNIDTIYLDTDQRVIYDVIEVLEKVREEYKKQQEFQSEQERMMKKIISTPYVIENEETKYLLEEIKKYPFYPIDKDAYYHGSILKSIIDIIRKGSINCKYRLGQRGGGSNGDYYVCVAKKLEVNRSAFEAYIQNKISIILKKELPMIDKLNIEFNFLNPFFQDGKKRSYHFEDEFQVKDRIEFSYFEGIYVPTKTSNDLIDIRKIIDTLETFHRNLPIISNESNTLVDKELIKTYVKPEKKEN